MTTTRATFFAVLVAALGLTAFAPAQAAGPQRRPDNDRMLDFRRDGNDGAYRLAGVSCGDRAVDRLENRLDRISDQLDLSTSQQKLFEIFRTSALTAQTDFSDVCETVRPDRSASNRQSDMVQRLEQRLKLDGARLTAMNSLLPHFKDFYASLTDEQKGELMPMRGFRHGMHMHRNGPDFSHRSAKPAAAGAGDELDG